MSPKSIARWQELKAKKLSGRTVPEDMEYKKLQMKHNADVLALNELKWKAELAEAVMLSFVASYIPYLPAPSGHSTSWLSVLASGQLI